MSRTSQKLLALITLLLGMSVAFAGCDSQPVKPVDETKNKLHDNPTKAVLILTEGTLDGTSFTGSGASQTMIFDAEGEWGPTKDSPNEVFVVKGDGKTAYFLEIHYYGKQNREITEEFVTNGQEKIHQHFFIARHFKPEADAAGKNYRDGDTSVYDYVYLDTNPWNLSVEKGAKLIKDNPIGMKGAFRFFKPGLTFRMRLMLMHGRGNKLNGDGVISPFNRPTKAQITHQAWDIDFSVPFEVK